MDSLPGLEGNGKGCLPGRGWCGAAWQVGWAKRGMEWHVFLARWGMERPVCLVWRGADRLVGRQGMVGSGMVWSVDRHGQVRRRGAVRQGMGRAVSSARIGAVWRGPSSRFGRGR